MVAVELGNWSNVGSKGENWAKNDPSIFSLDDTSWGLNFVREYNFIFQVKDLHLSWLMYSGEKLIQEQ